MAVRRATAAHIDPAVFLRSSPTGIIQLSGPDFEGSASKEPMPRGKILEAHKPSPQHTDPSYVSEAKKKAA